ncbi:MAG: ABC transporter ATP-binding protein [Acidobacteria bacterium]|nr:ABC transporter ATP-binding protein [Acidobacteriota bacterium]
MAEPIITFEKVSKVFAAGEDVRALDEIDLQIMAGERIAIMGQSGSGKSTLLNIMCGLEVPTSGRVMFDFEPLYSMNDDDRTRLRREKIGMIFQTFNLMPTLDAVENVSLPLRLDGVNSKEAAMRARRLLADVGLAKRVDHRPAEMSGGERQRVAIARALVFEPLLLLADEPTGNLDSKTGDEILELLDEIHADKKMTIVLVTHNEHAGAHCDRMITMLDGRILR